MTKGKLFVVEGLDGSGKQTQSQLLYERLLCEGYKVKKVEYPNYSSESSALVKMYLRGEFGSKPEDVDAYVSSTFFAADRYASYKTDYENFYDEGGIVIADRYTTSNMVHQASKIHNEEEWNKFLDWLWDLEFNIYKIPVPYQVFFLDIKPDISQKLIVDRENKFSHEQAKDIHERDFAYLSDSYVNALKIAQKYNWHIINCVDNGNLKPISEINDILFKEIKKYI